MSIDATKLYDKPNEALFIKGVLKEIKDEGLRCSDEIKYYTHAEQGLWDVTLSSESAEKGAHFFTFHPVSKEWEEYPTMFEEGLYFHVQENGWAEYIGEDPDQLSMVFKQPREVADFLVFYHNAKKYISEKIEWIQRPLAELFSSISIPVYLENKGFVQLPIYSSDTLQEYPKELMRQIELHLFSRQPTLKRNESGELGLEAGLDQSGGLALEGGIPMDAVIQQHEEFVRSVCRPIGNKGFILGSGALKPLHGNTVFKKPTISSFILEPDTKKMSYIYAQEFLGNDCKDNNKALETCLCEAISLNDFNGYLQQLHISLPAQTPLQTRVGLELREMRDAIKSAIEDIIESSVYAEAMFQHKVRLFDMLEKMGK